MNIENRRISKKYKLFRKLKYILKRNCIDILLVILAINLLFFCCDESVIKGFEIYNHTGKDFLYDISMALLTTIFIYFVQKKYTHFKQVKKYDKIVLIEFMNIVDCIKDMIWMITGEIDYLNVSKEMIQNKLQNIDDIGSKYNINNNELSLREAILYEDKKMLQRIDEIIAMPFLDDALRDSLFELRTFNMHKEWEKMLANSNGKLNTVAHKNGESYGGIIVYLDRDKKIAQGIEQCINKIKEMNEIIEMVYGYEMS